MVSTATGNTTLDAQFVAIVDEVTGDLLAGKHVDFDEVIRKHPEHAQPLREIQPTLMALAEWGNAELPTEESQTQAGPAGRFALGDYRLLRVLGRGGMGIVYEAEQLSLNRRVAVKMLPFAALLDARQLARFKNEARAAAALDHPHIVSVHAVGQDRGVHYYAMQLIEGMSLAEALESPESRVESPEKEADESLVSRDAVAERGSRQQPSPHSPLETTVAAALSTQRTTNPKRFFESVAQLGIQAANALQYAHDVGIVHRDIKPSNLLLDENGNLFVTDFGLAMTHGTGDANLTLSGDLLGTLRYMSPEQAIGSSGTTDHRTDIYSLGITLYELATGVPAFTHADRAKNLHRIIEQNPTPPRKLNAVVPRDLETIIRKAINKDPSHRYGSMKALAEDLQHFLADRPVTARRPSRTSRAIHWVRRNRVVSGLAACIIALLTNGATLIRLAASVQSGLLAVVLGDWPYQPRSASIVIWDVNAGEARQIIEIPGEILCSSATFSEDGKYIAVPSGNSVVVIDVARGATVHTLDCGAFMRDVDFSPDGRYLACAGNDGRTQLFSVPDFEKQPTIRTDRRLTESIAFSPIARRWRQLMFRRRLRPSGP